MINQERHYWRSFGGGEISPEMYGRVDLAKHQTGLKRVYNFSITPQGVAVKRTGTQYIAPTLNYGGTESNVPARLETFVDTNGRGTLLEIGAGYIRAHQGTPTTVLPTSYSFDDVTQLGVAQFSNDLTIVHRKYPPAVLQNDPGVSWTYGPIVFNAALTPPTGVLAAAFVPEALPVGDPRITYRYVVTSRDEDGVESAQSLATFAPNVLRIAGSYNKITWNDVTGAFRYNVYCSRGIGAYGFIGTVESEEFVDDNITPDSFSQPPEILEAFGSTGNYPGAVAFHQQRVLFANTDNDPQSFWASGLAGFGYFKASYPPQDDQAFTYELATKRAAPILHVLTLRDVLFFTAAGVFRVYTATDEPFTPSTVNAIPVNSTGAAPFVRPQEAGGAVLFPAARGAHLMALQYDSSGEGYAASDLSLIAPHIIKEYSWLQTAMQHAPQPIWWGVRSDGVLIGVTYIAEQQVLAWFRWQVAGARVESVAVVPQETEQGASADTVYIIARRTVNGTVRRYIERFAPEMWLTTSVEDAEFLDSSTTYAGAPTNEVFGLSYLEGQDVWALVDGIPEGPHRVTDGKITTDSIGFKIHVGLLYSAELETLPLAYEAPGYGVGVAKNASAVYLRVQRSAGLEAGPDFDTLRPMLPPVDELISDIPHLVDGVHEISIDGAWTLDTSIAIRQRAPFPVTINGLAIDFVRAE